jgi:putrescine transport system permease protein
MKPAAWFDRRGWSDLIIGVPYAWAVVFILLPILIVSALSVAVPILHSPPYAFLRRWPYLSTDNFRRLFTDSIYIRSFGVSLLNASIATVLCLLIGYPMALGLTRVSKAAKRVLLMLIVLPFWTSFLLRVYAWIGLMGNNSWFNRLLTALYDIVVPQAWHLANIQIMYTNFAVIFVVVYSYLPFMILPLYANLEKLDRTIDEAAMDLGARPFQVFLDVTLPLSMPGIIAGGLLVFIPTAGELVIPSLVGNMSDPMIGAIISEEFGLNHDWPMAAAISVALLIVLVVPLMAYTRFQSRAEAGGVS